MKKLFVFGFGALCGGALVAGFMGFIIYQLAFGHPAPTVPSLIPSAGHEILM